MENKKCGCSDVPTIPLWSFVSRIVLTTLVLTVVGLGIWAIINNKASS